MRPKLLTAVLTSNIDDISKNNLIAYKGKGEPVLFIDAQLNYDDLKILIDNNDGILSHIIDKSLHWSPSDRRGYLDYKDKLDIHIKDDDIHVTQRDKDNWNSKETEEGAQLKANAVIELLEIHINDLDVHVTKKEKDRWNNTYTREQVSSLLNAIKSGTAWKEAVQYVKDLYTTYPNPEVGWICTVLSTNTAYIYAERVWKEDFQAFESDWIVAFTNSIPLATENNDGQMTKAHFIKLENIDFNANYYVHPDNINCRHVTDAEKKIWSNKASKDLASIFSSGLMSSYDKEKLDTVEKYANYYVHPDRHTANDIEQDMLHRFVTDAQISLWNDKPTGKLASEDNDGQMSKENFIKLFNIEEKANYYVHPLKHSSTDISQDMTHRFVTDAQISKWDNKEDGINSQYRADKALEFAKEYTDQKLEQLIGVSPGVLDTFEELAKALGNDPDFAANVTIELSNKVDKYTYSSHVSDYNTHLSAADRLRFNTIEYNANYYIHPDTHPASMIIGDPNNRFITDAERTDWNSKANGNIATEVIAGQMSPAMVRKLNSMTTTGKITSDWNETDPDAGSYIRNKPEAMPAHGGNSETVNSYTAMELVNSRKGSTVVIGTSTSGFTEKDVDFLCDGTDDATIISNAFDAILEKGGSIMFREGVYLIKSTLTFSHSNSIIKGSGGVILEAAFSTVGSILNLPADNCTISGIEFKGKNNDTSCISIQGNSNVIDSCKFSIGNGIDLIEGNFNKFTNNAFNTGATAIYLRGDTHSILGNIISNNSIIDYFLGINIESDSTNTNGNNVISTNTIYNCFSGIKLTNILQSHNSKYNVITNNTIMRGTGLTSDYLYEQHTIRIEKGSYNMVSNNVLPGRDVTDEGINNTVYNNISV